MQSNITRSTWSWGTLTTYYLIDAVHPVHDKVYKWYVDDPNNNEIVYLDITFQGDIDVEDEWDKTDRYIVEKLTSTEMLLKEVKVDNDETILRFIRRNDLQLP